jgi:hypothetical protein
MQREPSRPRAAGLTIMTHPSFVPGDARGLAVIDTLVARHGAWPVLLRALRARFGPARPSRAAGTHRLSDHLRRDIGLPPLAPAPRDWRDLR